MVTKSIFWEKPPSFSLFVPSLSLPPPLLNVSFLRQVVLFFNVFIKDSTKVDWKFQSKVS